MRDEGRPPPCPAPESPRSSCSGRSVGLISDPKAPPGSLRRPRGSPLPGGSVRRRAARERARLLKGRRGTLPTRAPLGDGANFSRSAVPDRRRGARAPGGAGWGGGQKRWVGAKVARCGEGSIRRAFAFPESVIVCRFFYKDWTTII